MIVSHVRVKNWRNFQRVSVALRERQFIVGVKPKITRPVSKLGLLMQLPSGTAGCIARQMPVGSAHRELRVVVRDCTPLASYR